MKKPVLVIMAGEWIISHFELECRLKPGDYPLSCYVVVGDVLKRLVKQERPQ